MSDLPGSARVVVIGAGIVGNSLAHHLARLGWKDIVLLDKGPFPSPGGSTGHASNFIYPVDHSKEMTLFTQESVRQYRELGVFTQSGGVEVARTKERLEELKRRLASARSWGEDAELLSPAEVKRRIPFLNEKIILGGFYCPGVGVVDSLRAGTLMRERAQAEGALRVFGNTEVLGIDVQQGRVRGVRTSRGDLRTEVVAICCGIWSPRIARMAGASIPLSPAVHQMIDVGPVPLFARTVGEIEYPIVRDMDTNMYERQQLDYLAPNARYQPRPKAVGCMPWFAARYSSPSSGDIRAVQNPDNGFDELLAGLWVQSGHLSNHQLPAGGEQLARPGVTVGAKRARGEARRRQVNGSWVAVWVAGDLGEDPVTAAGVGQDDSRAKLRLGEI